MGFGWGDAFVAALFIAASFKSAIADWNVVSTGSMEPTIVKGNRIFVNKLAYDLKIPYTIHCIARMAQTRCGGDIFVFYSPVDDTRLVKRVVGLFVDKFP